MLLSLQGPVRFNQYRERFGTVIIKQNRGGSLDNSLTIKKTNRKSNFIMVDIMIRNWKQQRHLLFKHGGLKANNIAYEAVLMGSIALGGKSLFLIS